MIKSTGGHPMATKASNHLGPYRREAACFMGPHGYRLTCLEVHFRCQLRIASAQPILGPSGPCARVVVHVYVELSYGLLLACTTSSGLLRLAWQQLDTHIVDLGAGWPHTVPRRRSGRASSTAAGVCPVLSGVKLGPAAYTNDTVPSPGCVLQGLRPW